MGRHGPGEPEVAHTRVEFGGGTGTIGAARTATGDYLSALAAHTPATAPDARDNLLLVVSELVTNAVRHAPGPCALDLSHCASGVRVVVSDGSTRLPRARAADFSGGGGFGWPLVNRLAREVRAEAYPGGKDVLAVIPW